MDCNTPGNNLPPLYPFSYPDGSFYDKPGRQCVDKSVVSWTGVVLLSTADFTNKKLTTYEGIIWGFDVACQPVPEPASILSIGLGLATIIVKRRKHRPGNRPL